MIRQFFSSETPLPVSLKTPLGRAQARPVEVSIDAADWASTFRELDLSLNADARSFYCSFAPKGRACFAVPILTELRRMQKDLRGVADTSSIAPRAGRDFDFMIVASSTPGVYNLGGDLALFHKLVREQNRKALTAYARLCVDVVRDNAEAYGAPITTIAAVQGSCLGGGFEAALSCDVIIAEDHVKFGFPEILFGLFPGMGAVNFLTRRVTQAATVRLLLGGNTYSAAEMHELGLVDQVVAKGEALNAANAYIEKRKRAAHASAAVHECIRGCQHFNDEEFDNIITRWVDAALKLTERDLDKMIRLSDAQERQRNRRTTKSAPVRQQPMEAAVPGE